MNWCLSVHAGYACRHSGACCRTAWEVPVDAAVYRRLRDVDGGGRFAPAGDVVRLAHAADGACLFLDRGSRLCTIHRDHGPGLLPTACRMFPRVFLGDARGGFVSLSHYCPTAAGLLFDEMPLTIVPAPSTLVDVGELDGLDARDAWPPLLRPDVLMDLDAYGVWEQLLVETLGGACDPVHALDRIDAAAQRITAWSPGGTPLRDAVIRAFEQDDEAAAMVDEDTLVRLVRDAVPAATDLSGRKALTHKSGVWVRASCPDIHKSGVWVRASCPDIHKSGVWVRASCPDIHKSGVWVTAAPFVGRWLAARAFACWIAYQGRGLRTIVLYLRACLALLTAELRQNGGPADRAAAIEAIRRADLLLIHQADSAALAASLDRLAYSR